jgi:DHA2 family multidrug resistance protein
MAMIDARWVATLSFVGFAASFFIRADLSPGAGFWDYVLPMLALGVGMSLFFVALLTISLNGIQPQKVPAASGLINFARITAGSFATAMATTIWDRREAVHQTRLADSISLYDPATSQALAGMHTAGLSQSESFGTMTETLVNQAYFMSAIDIFWVSGWLCIALIPMVWLTKRAMGNSGPKVAAD